MFDQLVHEWGDVHGWHGGGIPGRHGGDESSGVRMQGQEFAAAGDVGDGRVVDLDHDDVGVDGDPGLRHDLGQSQAVKAYVPSPIDCTGAPHLSLPPFLVLQEPSLARPSTNWMPDGSDST